MEINLINGSNVFFTSDPHFYHRNIIRFCNRPFNNVDEMNETLINNWNATVKETDTIFILGDFAFAQDSVIRKIINRLAGIKIFIRGNHDKSLPEDKFITVVDILKLTICENSSYKNFILTHVPLLTWAHRNTGTINLFGHVHFRDDYNGGIDNDILSKLNPLQYDVGVDLNNFTPISFKEVMNKIMKQVETNSNCTMWFKHE